VSIVADHLNPWQRHAQAVENRCSARATGRVSSPDRWVCLAAAFACVGAGCTHYQPSPLEPQRSAQQFAARDLSDPQLRDEIGRVLPLAVAFVRNPELAVAQAQVQAVMAREVTAAQAPNPDLILQSEYARHDAHPWLYGIGLDWLLRSNERRRLDIALARADTGNARLQLMDQTWSVRSALASALSDGESARRHLALLDRLAAAQDRLVTLERQRVGGGEDSPSELVTGQRARIEIEQQQSRQRVIANTSQAAAAQALGLPPQALDGIVVAWPDWGEPPPLAQDELAARREQALLSRADLGVAIGEYAAAETRLHQAVARQYPELMLEPGYYWDHGIAKFPFDVGFTLPLNRNKGEIAEARADREVAGRHMLAVQAGIYGEIAAAERAEQWARASVATAEQQLQAARQQERQADLALRVGAVDALEQVGAAITAINAELELVQMRALLQESRNELEDAVHAPLSGPEIGLAISFTSSTAAGGGS
jgi:CRISPR system Cascade subunit CasA